jgi:hypothetical protein
LVTTLQQAVQEIVVSRSSNLNRRSFLHRITSGAGAVTGALAAIQGTRASASPGWADHDVFDIGIHAPPNTDRDPMDEMGHAGEVRNRTDSDRSDRPGHGAGAPHDQDRSDPIGHPRNSPTGFTGYTDRDTYDTAYHGRAGGSGLSDHDGRDTSGHGMGPAGATDNDSNDPVGRGRGTFRSDTDANDAAGRGRGTTPASPRGSTDRDANDAAGHGRGPTTPVTDRDPTDRPGQGRGASHPPPISNSTSLGHQANPGVTDADPNDTAGHGRGTGSNGPR